MGRHSGFSISSCSYLLHPPSTTAMSSFTTSINVLLLRPVSSFLATPSSASFSQYTNHLSSVHFLSMCFLWFTHSWSCPFLSLLMRIVTLTLPPPSPSFRQYHRLQPVQHCWSHCHLVHLPFHSSWTLFVPLSPCISNLPLSPLLAFLLCSYPTYRSHIVFLGTCPVWKGLHKSRHWKNT